jgi:hypothetical protein
MTKDFANKAVTELRALAKLKGIKGYSAMRKDELVAALSSAGARKRAARTETVAPARAAKPPRKKPVQPRARSPKPTGALTGRTVAAPEPSPREQARVHLMSDEEQRIEDAKYVTSAPGGVASIVDVDHISGEATDALPELRTPMLCALLQKPGVLHVYWVLQPGAMRAHASLKLRVSYVSPERNQMLHEIAVMTERGHWYFRLDPGLASGQVLVQLGHYRDDDLFVTLLRHAVERFPRLVASLRTDPAWSVSEEQFRKMYEQAGGALEDGQPVWSDTTPHVSSK